MFESAISNVGGGGLLLVVGYMLFRLNRSENTSAKAYRDQLSQQSATITNQGQQLAAQQAQITNLGEKCNRMERRNFRCEFRMTLALASMRHAGIDIPKELLADDDGE